MTTMTDFEQGPIRPPSEARSLLLRVSRNCPWNKCTFCPVYKRRKFSRRNLEEVVADIDAMAAGAEVVRQRSRKLGYEGEVPHEVAQAVLRDPRASQGTKSMAVWLYHGGETIFLQDANAVLGRQDFLLGVLGKLREAFPLATRITSYGRSHTLATKPVDKLVELREAGLGRIHVGLESGHDPVLKLIRKGTTAAQQIEAGRRVKAAGIHVCFYVMPGLGGRAFSEGHARDTARVTREVDPDRVRLRSLVVHPRTPLAELVKTGEFEPLDDEEMVDEVGRFVDGLEGCTGDLVSDHDLNLLMELRGHLSHDRQKLLDTIARFKALDDRERLMFIIGRRTHTIGELAELDEPVARARLSAILESLEAQAGGDLSAVIQALRERMV